MIFIIIVLAVFAAALIYGSSFPSIGRAEGVIWQVETELHNDTEAYRHDRMRIDPRMYRYYVKYYYEGNEYVAKSWRAYQAPKYFPGDKVTVRISLKSMTLVDIVKASSNRTGP